MHRHAKRVLFLLLMFWIFISFFGCGRKYLMMLFNPETQQQSSKKDKTQNRKIMEQLPVSDDRHPGIAGSQRLSSELQRPSEVLFGTKVEPRVGNKNPKNREQIGLAEIKKEQDFFRTGWELLKGRVETNAGAQQNE